MTATRPRVIVTRKLPETVEDRMRELFDAALNDTDEAMSREAILSACAGADVLAPTLGDPIDADFIAALPESVKLIANFGAGVDHIDIAAAHAKGLIVTNTPGVLTEDTADLTMLLILAAPRRLAEGVKALEAGRFTGWAPTWMMGRRIAGLSLGVLGLGRIGQAVARRARAFGMSIHYHNRNKVSPAIEEELEATYWDSLGQMLAHVDVVTVNCPKTPATFHLLSRRRLEMLKPNAFVVNTSRGEIIDEDALADFLEAGKIAGAALDVFEHEPAVNPRLAALENVLLVPHMGSSTLESRTEMGEKAIINIRVWQDGERPPDRVVPEEETAT